MSRSFPVEPSSRFRPSSILHFQDVGHAHLASVGPSSPRCTVCPQGPGQGGRHLLPCQRVPHPALSGEVGPEDLAAGALSVLGTPRALKECSRGLPKAQCHPAWGSEVAGGIHRENACPQGQWPGLQKARALATQSPVLSLSVVWKQEGNTCPPPKAVLVWPRDVGGETA